MEPEKVNAGDKIDVLDSEKIWCQAVIELKFTSVSRAPLFYIHYIGWSRKYDESIYANSKRIAPFGLYTSREDLPRYCIDYTQGRSVSHAAIASNREEYDR